MKREKKSEKFFFAFLEKENNLEMFFLYVVI